MTYYNLSEFIIGTNSDCKTVVFIDSRVNNVVQLLKKIMSNAIVIILEPERDGIEQITQNLQQGDYHKVHIISGGSPGCLHLGICQLSLDTIEDYYLQLRSWFTSYFMPRPSRLQKSLPTLFLYGCDVGIGDAGAEFISKLHQITRVNVTTSVNLAANDNPGKINELKVVTNKQG